VAHRSHLGEERLRHGVGDLRHGLRGGRRVVAVATASRGVCRLTASSVSGGDLGGLDSVSGAVLGASSSGLLENFAHFLDSEYLHWGNLL